MTKEVHTKLSERGKQLKEATDLLQTCRLCLLGSKEAIEALSNGKCSTADEAKMAMLIQRFQRRWSKSQKQPQ